MGTEGAAGASRPLSKWELKNWEPSRGKKKPKPQGGNIRRSSTLPFESSLAPEFLSLFASMLPFVLQSYPQKVWAKDTSPCCVFLESRVINIGSARDAARAATKRASFESVSMLFMSGRAAIARWGLEKLWHSWLHIS